jgi:hypothetical protein
MEGALEDLRPRYFDFSDGHFYHFKGTWINRRAQIMVYNQTFSILVAYYHVGEFVELLSEGR